ncbi:MAG: addiction module protein [Deltaproteobacteria bacterium]|nr:addiction module protein [Deltaproteobacteria bacterium]
MTRAELQKEVLDLPVPEKLELVEDLMESLRGETIPVPNWQLRELQDRMKKYGSESGQLWDEVRSEVWPPSE